MEFHDVVHCVYNYGSDNASHGHNPRHIAWMIANLVGNPSSILNGSEEIRTVWVTKTREIQTNSCTYRRTGSKWINCKYVKLGELFSRRFDYLNCMAFVWPPSSSSPSWYFALQTEYDALAGLHQIAIDKGVVKVWRCTIPDGSQLMASDILCQHRHQFLTDHNWLRLIYCVNIAINSWRITTDGVWYTVSTSPSIPDGSQLMVSDILCRHHHQYLTDHSWDTASTSPSTA